MLTSCLTTACDAGPASNLHWVNVSYLLREIGVSPSPVQVNKITVYSRTWSLLFEARVCQLERKLASACYLVTVHVFTMFTGHCSCLRRPFELRGTRCQIKYVINSNVAFVCCYKTIGNLETKLIS